MRPLTRRAAHALACAATIVLACTLAPRLSAQSSIVPATHPVYDWLYQQRVFGRLPEYEYEVRPTSRSVILTHLRTLEADSAQLSWTDRRLLNDFLNEFDFARLTKNGLFRHGLLDSVRHNVLGELLARRDPYVYAGPITDTSITGALWLQKGWGEGWRSGGAQPTDYAFIWAKGVRAFVNSSFGLGFHAEIEGAIANDPFVLGLDPRLGVYEEFLRTGDKTPAAFETWLSYRRPKFEVVFGKGAQAIGPAVTDPLVLRLGAPRMSTLRVTIGPPRFHLMFLNGQLAGPLFADTAWIDGKPDVVQNVVPRWVAMTRLSWSPTTRFTATLNQMTVYSRRGLDFAYLNPLLPSLFGGLEKGSADNGFVGLDLVGRPFTGTEVFMSLLNDDATGYEFRSLGNQYQKVGLTFGAQQRLPYDVTLGASWMHIDPYMYAHGVSTDAWTTVGVPMGPQVGPNAEETAWRLTRWFPWRTKVTIESRYVRKGLNPVDSLGNVTAFVGGDINAVGSVRGQFMAGADVQTYRRDEVGIDTEPIRGWHITAAMNSIVVRSGTRTPGLHTWLIRWTYGF